MNTYCPWVDLGQRHPHVHVDQYDIYPARAAWVPDADIIIIDRRLTRTEGRSTLAHEIAHIDLGHLPTDLGHFGARQEKEAAALAARRLIPITRLAEALLWCRDDHELAEELNVDQQVLMDRRAILTPSESAYIETRLASIEVAA